MQRLKGQKNEEIIRMNKRKTLCIFALGLETECLCDVEDVVVCRVFAVKALAGSSVSL